tara:strand:- start:729 stop:1697 length:969 start_codon:yes stop_codon:yes gene_type:complete
MQKDNEPYKPEDKEDTSPEKEKSFVPEDPPESKFEDKQEIPPEAEELSVSEGTPDPEFEEQQGEFLPPEKKKRSGRGFVLLILVLLIGCVGYLYYAKQIPPIIREPLESLLKPLKNQLDKFRPESISGQSKKTKTKVKKTVPTTSVQEEALKEATVFEKEIKKIPSPTEQHVSGFQMESTSEISKGLANYTAEISGNTMQIEQKPKTLVKNSKVETQLPEAEAEADETEAQVNKTKIEKEHEVETKKEEAPWVSPIMASVPHTPPKPAEKRIEETAAEEKLAERSEAVQAYLDFVELTVVKTGELIKKGFKKGKVFLLKFLS